MSEERKRTKEEEELERLRREYPDWLKSSWKANSLNFACDEYSEAQPSQ